MSLKYSGAVVAVLGFRGIVGCSGIEIMCVVGDVPADLVDSRFTWRP